MSQKYFKDGILYIDGRKATKKELEDYIKRDVNDIDNRDQVNYALGAMGLTAAAVPTAIGYTDDLDNFAIDSAKRAITLDDLGIKGLDPTIRTEFLKTGPRALNTGNALERLKALIPEGYTGFEPSDLSNAGGNLELTPGNFVQRQISVSPSAQPRRLSYKGLTDADIEPNYGQKGYVWANPENERWTYAQGNFNRGKVTSTNPAVNYLDVEMPPSDKTDFQVTSDITRDPSFIGRRVWGQRQYGKDPSIDGDVMFPKENIVGRREVTAADVYTDLRNRNIDIKLGDFEGNPGAAFQELVEGAAEKTGRTPRQLLLELSTPVEPLGETPRFAGKLPLLEQFNLEGASSENKRKAGIGSVYVDPLSENPTGYYDNNRVLVQSQIGDELTGRYKTNFEINPKLLNPTNLANRAGQFLKRQTGNGMFAGASLAMDPNFNEAIEKGDTSGALRTAGLTIGGGALVEAGTKKILTELAKKGVTSPLNVATGLSPQALAIQIASQAERSTPKTDWSKVSDDSPQKQYMAEKLPTEIGNLGPNLPHANLPEEEQIRIRTLPAKTRQVKTLLPGNQLAYNINNQFKYIKDSIAKGEVPYFTSNQSNNSRQEAVERSGRYSPEITIDGVRYTKTDEASRVIGPDGESRGLQYLNGKPQIVNYGSGTAGRKEPPAPATPARTSPTTVNTSGRGAGRATFTAPAPKPSYKTPQRIMAVLNGKEGIMLQGDPTSFRRANWNDDQKKRYYGR